MQTLWECAGLQLCIFSTLSERPAFALVVGLSYSFLRSCVELGYAYWYYWMEVDLLRPHAPAPDAIEPTTVYTDMHTGSFAKCLAAFCAQTTLFVLFFIAVTQQEAITQENENTQILQFCLGACISSVVRLFDTSFVKGEYRSVWKNYITYYPNYYDRSHLFVARFLMSFLANSVLSMATLFLLPVVLMNADNFMEFVKDATCVLFIAELDTLQIVTAAQKIPGQDPGQTEHLPRAPSEPSHCSLDHEEDDGKDDPFHSQFMPMIPRAPRVAWERPDRPGSPGPPGPPGPKEPDPPAPDPPVKDPPVKEADPPEPDPPKVKEPNPPQPHPPVKEPDPPAQKFALKLGADLPPAVKEANPSEPKVKEPSFKALPRLAPKANCSFLRALPMPAPATEFDRLEPPWGRGACRTEISSRMSLRPTCTAGSLPGATASPGVRMGASPTILGKDEMDFTEVWVPQVSQREWKTSLETLDATHVAAGDITPETDPCGDPVLE